MHVLHTIWRKAYCRAEAFFRTGSTPFYAHVKCLPDRPVCGTFARRFSACNFVIAALLMLLTANQSALAVPPGTLISNTASASFEISGNPETRPSNTVEISAAVERALAAHLLRVPEVADVAGQEILTADKVSLRLNLLATFRVSDPRASVEASGDLHGALYRELAGKQKEIDRLVAAAETAKPAKKKRLAGNGNGK